MLSFLLLQHTNDFALYTEAIKFFNHPESMVRIAVRTITLNVYKGMLSISKEMARVRGFVYFVGFETSAC